MISKTVVLFALSLVSTFGAAQQPTTYKKPGAHAEIAQASDELNFFIVSTVEQSRCELEGTATRIDANRFGYTANEMSDMCVAMLTTKGGRLSVTTKGCESACGLDAAGSMDGVYVRK